MTYYPSILNDVIGPIMRGPSSSHSAAAHRIGRMARDLMDHEIHQVRVEFEKNSSLETTHTSQGSDMGLFGGLLGWEMDDPRLVDAEKALAPAGIQVSFKVLDRKAVHPSAYGLVLKNSKEEHSLIANSVGGGIIEIIDLDGEKVLMAGDYFETLIYPETEDPKLLGFIEEKLLPEEMRQTKKFIEVKTRKKISKELVEALRSNHKIKTVKQLNPVLPILSCEEVRVPFFSCEEMLNYNQGKDLDLSELALIYESQRGGISKEEVFHKMKRIVEVLEDSIALGLKGTQYEDRILGFQSGGFQEKMGTKGLIESGALNLMTLYVTSLMEMKSSMGLIVAAPTAGACGCLPGACLGAGDYMKRSLEQKTRAFLGAGLIGVFIAKNFTLSAEVGGCQAECGAGSGMAAAGLCHMNHGNVQQAVNAASMALQNILGMICDPIANRVEAPCLGRNVLGASNALACANMALADFDPVIPLDETIKAMDAVGKTMPYELRCTALGGLSITKTSKEIEQRLNRKKD